MKKITIVFALVVLPLISHNLCAQSPYVGGSLNAVYFDNFQFKTHFLGGYEFNDKWAIGGCIGLDINVYDDGAANAGFIGAYVRFTPWHNDVLYTDIKWRTEALIQEGIDGADIGLIGSLRFRVCDHVDIFTDFLPLGMRVYGGENYPFFGILSDGCTLGLHYRF
ncbi:MAG: hypothetical protein IJL58_04630 [Bacteroidales bacterium]|nr:hypothetical protein [Bacteroidales bacterium]MBQ6185827.1 hypothetical protein [Bacteroidales bacterium]